MISVLFTKSIDKKNVSNFLGAHFLVNTLEVIKTKSILINKFDLNNSSLIFTSANGVKAFFENGFKPNEDFTAKNYNKIYCVGEKTKKELCKNGFGTFKVLKNAETLSKFITENCVHEKFIHFCGNLAIDVLDKKLPLQNIAYKKVTVYHTEELQPKITEKYHAIVFFSPSGVRSFAENNSLENTMLFSIGETTTKELKKFSQNRILTSKESNLDDLLSLIRCQLSE